MEGSLVETLHLNKFVRKKLSILHDISLIVKPNEFVVVVGQSGGGKTTLVDAIAGFRTASSGQVFVDGIDVYRNVNSMRDKIGYVPQRDIIHMELTVYQALDFSARLRLPRGTKSLARKARINEVLDELGLEEQRDVRISELSGGQQKRVSIGVELLTRPRLFFLDEPTSGLDPGNETAFMNLMRRLADEGRTVIMITHTTKNVMLADKVIFMNTGGYLAWFGPPREALAYFSQFRPGQGKLKQFDDIYAMLDDPGLGTISDWADRYRASPAYQKYIAGPLQPRQDQLDQKTQPSPASLPKKTSSAQARTDKRRIAKINRISSLRQLLILSARNLIILTRDRTSLVLMLLIAPFVGSVDFVIASIVGKNVFSYAAGDPYYARVSLFFMCIYALMVGAISQMREIVKEASIYRRERLVNLRIFPYVASKVWVALLLAFYHAAAFTLIHYVAFKMPGGAENFIEIYVTEVLAVMTGMMVGLIASAISNNPGVTPLVMICLVTPMFLLSGGLATTPLYLSGWMTPHWALQGLSGISGMGSDVMRDRCWQMDPKLRDAMTIEDKTYFQCPCMGLNIFKKDSCNFPGLGAFYVPEISESAPQPPPAMAAAPPEPVLPAPPDPIQDISNQIQVVQYLNALKQYQQEVGKIQAGYKAEMDVYQGSASVYQGEVAKYQEDLAYYNVARATAVSTAEGLIKGVAAQAEWSWVDKSDPKVYYPWLFETWGAQILLVVIYFSISLGLVKAKDVH
ncbi:MAG TPA: ATP-binding cassette domain-containing protein [Anaerolineales bacterium]|nr:ATP-binding cassette domain-containing protein [Anaerolineales bacterium]